MNSFHIFLTDMKYVQDYVNTFCFSISVSAMYDVREYITEQASVLRIKLSLLCECFGYKDRIEL